MKEEINKEISDFSKRNKEILALFSEEVSKCCGVEFITGFANLLCSKCYAPFIPIKENTCPFAHTEEYHLENGCGGYEDKQEKKCCKKCYTNYTTDDYPAHETLDACLDPTCDCHIKCDGECHFQDPYGFVPHASCPLHDKMTEKERKEEKKCDSCGSPKAKLGYHKCSPKEKKCEAGLNRLSTICPGYHTPPHDSSDWENCIRNYTGHTFSEDQINCVRNLIKKQREEATTRETSRMLSSFGYRLEEHNQKIRTETIKECIEVLKGMKKKNAISVENIQTELAKLKHTPEDIMKFAEIACDTRQNVVIEGAITNITNRTAHTSSASIS